MTLPKLALSVRQPWAWAIVEGYKDIENRTLGSIRVGGMDCRRIAIHAATGMRQEEYRWAVWKMQALGVTVPRPDQLPRGAIVGAVDVVEIITASDSHWFGGTAGLKLANAEVCKPIPAKGMLGYFDWKISGALEPAKPWMLAYDAPSGDRETLSLFPDEEVAFETPPEKPFGRRAR